MPEGSGAWAGRWNEAFCLSLFALLGFSCCLEAIKEIYIEKSPPLFIKDGDFFIGVVNRLIL